MPQQGRPGFSSFEPSRQLGNSIYMPRAIRIHEHGGAEVLRLETVGREPLGPRQVRIRQSAVGVNFIDTYDRSGLYPVSLPCGLGREAAGGDTEVGKSVKSPCNVERV